jgi:hypothetical protein
MKLRTGLALVVGGSAVWFLGIRRRKKKEQKKQEAKDEAQKANSMFWLYVNHPTGKARIHIDGGCHSVRQAAQRKTRKTPNGYWEGPYPSLQAVEMAQTASGKRIKDQCKLCFRSLSQE